MTDKNKINETVLKEILSISCIDLPEKEYPEVMNRINEVLRMCDEMGDLDLTDVRPFEWETSGPFSRREDLPFSWSGRDSFLKGAPVSDGDFFRVPRILAEDVGSEEEGI